MNHTDYNKAIKDVLRILPHDVPERWRMRIQALSKVIYRNLCYECGMIEHEIIRPDLLEHITVSMGNCEECGSHLGIVPASDWRNACRTDREPNCEEID